jgi:hypothetical protein
MQHLVIDDVFEGVAGYGEVVEDVADNDGAISGRSGRECEAGSSSCAYAG